MKVFFLLTHTPNCEPFWRSLEYLGHDVHISRYDDRPHHRHIELVNQAKDLQPDFIVYVGAYEPSHGLPVLHVDIFSRLKQVAPLILLCGDAADHPWWPVLESYHKEACFSVIVAMDGGTSPVDAFSEGITLLTPLDPRPFKPKHWAERDIRVGMVGGLGHRQGDIEKIASSGLMQHFNGPVGRSYADMAEVMCRTKLTFCCGKTGTGAHQHVKGRMVEAGFAQSAVLELRGSPASKWFVPGTHYLEYGNAEEAIDIIKSIDDNTLADVAFRFSLCVSQEHDPGSFWGKVLTKAGIM